VRPPGRGDGVLLAHGSRHAGYVLYVHEGRLVYEQSLAPWNERIESDVALPEGPVTVRYTQTMTARPFEGAGALTIGDRTVGTHTYERVLFSTSYDGFSIGADLGNQVSTRYRGPNRFAGEITKVRISVDTTAFNAIETMRFINAMGIRV